ncbi:MAG: hypothetical protein AAFO82_20690, partial [Bacteroidota bacterium]
MPIEEIRQLMLHLFEHWGLPKAIRTDNGEPFGAPSRDVIPFMSLWLEAWGIKAILNRPRTPQQNAHVEANQFTSARWAEITRCQTVKELQACLDEAARFQRDVYPVTRLGNASRKQVFKNLYSIPRPFSVKAFDEQKAYAVLAEANYPRKVSTVGIISLYSNHFNVGKKHNKEIIHVTFDPKNVEWVF